MDELKTLLHSIIKNQEETNAKIEGLAKEITETKKTAEQYHNETLAYLRRI